MCKAKQNNYSGVSFNQYLFIAIAMIFYCFYSLQVSADEIEDSMAVTSPVIEGFDVCHISSNDLEHLLGLEPGSISFNNLFTDAEGMLNKSHDLAEDVNVVLLYIKAIQPYLIKEYLDRAGTKWLNMFFFEKLGEHAKAANVLADSLIFYVRFGIEIPGSAGNLISQAVGKKEYQDVGKAVRQGTLSAFIIAIPQAAIGLGSEFLLTSVLRQPAESSALASNYLKGYTLGIPAKAVMWIGEELLSSSSHPNLVPVVYGSQLFLTGTIGYFLAVRGPELGLSGLGYADSIAAWLTVGGMAAYFKLNEEDFGKFELFKNDWKDPDVLKELWDYGWPTAVQGALMTGSISTLAFIRGKYGGDAALAAQHTAGKSTLFIWPVIVSISRSSKKLVGHAIGVGDADLTKEVMTTGLELSGAFAGAGMLVLVAKPEFFVSGDPANLPLVKKLILMEGLALGVKALDRTAKEQLSNFKEMSTRRIIGEFAKGAAFPAIGMLFCGVLKQSPTFVSGAEIAGYTAGAFILVGGVLKVVINK